MRQTGTTGDAGRIVVRTIEDRGADLPRLGGMPRPQRDVDVAEMGRMPAETVEPHVVPHSAPRAVGDAIRERLSRLDRGAQNDAGQGSGC